MSPSTLTLRPFQTAGVEFLASRRFAYLADRPGMGKTLQLAKAAHLRYERRRQKDERAGRQARPWKCLVICPAIAIPQWHNWLSTFSVRNASVLSFNALQDQPRLTGLCSTSWSLIIIDEAHFLQGMESNRTRAILAETGLIHSCESMWFASGTPTPRGDPRQVWAILYTTGATTLDLAAFTERFAKIRHTIKTFGGRMIEGPDGKRRLAGGKSYPREECFGLKDVAGFKALLAPFMLRRHEKDVMPELPPLLVEPYPVPVDPLDRKFFETWFPTYDATYVDKDAGFAAFEAMVRAGENILAAALDAEKRGNAAVLEDAIKKHEVRSVEQIFGLQKVPPLAALFKQELDDGAYEKIGIICKHKSVIREFEAALKDYGPGIIWGGQSAAARKKYIDEFREWKSRKVMLVQIDAAGVALDGLQICNRVALVEKSWVPDENEQAIKRFHRFDTTETVFVRDFYAVGTMDERKNEVTARRSKQSEQIFDTPTKVDVDDFWAI